jgi:hypothetical protein
MRGLGQSAELRLLLPVSTDLPFWALEQLCGTSSVAGNYSLTNLAPSPTDYRRLAIYTMLSVPVLSDLQSDQSVPRIQMRSRKHQAKGTKQTEQAGRIVRSPRSCWGSTPASHHASQTKEAPARPHETSHTARTCQSCQTCQVATRRSKTCGLSKRVIKSGLP